MEKDSSVGWVCGHKKVADNRGELDLNDGNDDPVEVEENHQEKKVGEGVVHG